MIFSNISSIRFLVLLAGCLTWLSCSDLLDIENEDNIPFDEFLNSQEGVREMVRGSYRALAEGNFMGGKVQNMSELMADNMDTDLVTNQDWLKHYNHRTDIFTSTTRDMMHAGGKVIGRANRALEFIPDFEFIADEAQRLEGECKFLRAIGHFELVRMFAQPYGYTSDNSHNGISVYTSSSIEPQPRASVNEVYTQIITDLQDAINLLPEENGVYATSWAAKGYLAKVYFQMNDFENAQMMAGDVIDNGGFRLDSIQFRFSRNGSPENIFSIIGTDGEGTDFDANGEQRNAYAPINQGRIQLRDAFFIGENALNDLRGMAYYDGNNLIKFEADNRQQAPLVHLTELLLIRAESLAELDNNLPTAIGDLSEVRERAGLTPVAQATPAEELISIARNERRYELVGEGNRLHDLKRRAVLENPDLLIRGIEWDCPGMVCQIPDNELAGNVNYPPNEEGGCQ